MTTISQSAEELPLWASRAGVRPESVQALVMQAIHDLVASEQLPYGASIGRLVGKNPSQVSRALQELRRRGRVVRGERVGSIVPYYLREMGE